MVIIGEIHKHQLVLTGHGCETIIKTPPKMTPQSIGIDRGWNPVVWCGGALCREAEFPVAAILTAVWTGQPFDAEKIGAFIGTLNHLGFIWHLYWRWE